MAQLSPEGAFETLKERVAESVSSFFPFEGKKHTLELNEVRVEDNKDFDDLRSQKAARISGRSWTVPVKADVTLKDKEGKELDRKTIQVAAIPKITRRYSYIVDGNEWQVDNQLRLKSGAYHRRTQAGDLESQWNAAKGRGFRMKFDPDKRLYRLEYGKAKNIALYPILKAMGVDDDKIERAWGRDIFSTNANTNEKQALTRFYKTVTGEAPEDLEQARQLVRESFAETELLPETTKITLGKPYTAVTGDALLGSASKLLSISRGQAAGDDRESLKFKGLFGVEDFVGKKVVDSGRDIRRRLGNNIDRKRRVREILTPDIFSRPVKSFFTSTSLSQRPDQTNPLEFISGQTRTTIMGEGGISSINQVIEDAKLINPSSLGFLDPVQTPESSRAGINLQLTLGAEKKGNQLLSRVFDVKKGKFELVDAGSLQDAVVAYPDQVRWSKGVPKPRSQDVKVSAAGGDIDRVPWSRVRYVLPSSKGLFGMTANTVPFLQSASGNRAGMATRQAEQAIPLRNREQPLVQVKTERDNTFEQILGAFNSHQSPVAGEVVRVKKDGIVIKDTKGKKHEVQIYNDFPLNSASSIINSTPLVSAGDKVKRGQVVADSNFTRDGVLALGTNARVGYLPAQGYNYEDGIVISEAAAKKLSSEHMHRMSIPRDRNVTMNKTKFLANMPTGVLTPDQRGKLDDDGVVVEGTQVHAGDVLIGALRRRELTQEEKMLSKLSKAIVKPEKNESVRWEKDVPGEVAKVVKGRTHTTVYVKTLEPAKVGDKLVGRHANKGIITRVIADDEMPKTEDGRPLEVLLNPNGVPSRMNPSQILETAASKIAEKTGKPYVVNNFDPDVDNYTAKVKADLEAAGLKDKEVVLDPKTGKPLGNVMVGNQYMYKLHHQIDKKISARSGGVGMPYDVNQIPRGGGDRGAKSLGGLGLYAMLNHGATANVREMMTSKGDRNDEYWTALQAGELLPTPRPPFAFEKLKGYMRVLGVDVEKKGNYLNLVPLTDDQIKKIAPKALPDAAKLVRAKDLRPHKGGLFDPFLTGGPGGSKWTRIELAEPMPNPAFEKAILSLTGLKKKEFEAVMSAEQQIDGKTSGAAITDMLSKIDVDKEIKDTEDRLGKVRGPNLDRANKKLKYLRVLKETGLSPVEAYTNKHVPVLPPAMRPVSQLPNGDINYDDLNGLYKNVSLVNQRLSGAHEALADEEQNALRKDLYDGLRALSLVGGTIRGADHKGALGMIKGDTPKHGFFQSKLTSRRQDMTLRSTIVPEPSLGLDEVGLPRKGAMQLYKPFVVRHMSQNMNFSPLDAQNAIRANHPAAKHALEKVIADRPILLKRDPVLHRFGVMAFQPKLVSGKAIRIHPLVTGGFNADFDGDQMTGFVPISKDAVAEARKMMPSKNLYNDTYGRVMYTPSQEAVLGLYGLTELGDTSGKLFKNEKQVLDALRKGEIKTTDRVKILGKETTPGRVQVAQALPGTMPTREKVLYDPGFVLRKKNLSKVVSDAAENAQGEFGNVVDKLKDLGNEHSYAVGESIGLDDIMPYKREKDVILAAAARRVAALPAKDREKALPKEYAKAMDDLEAAIKPKMARKGSALWRMMDSGARGKWNQVRQMVGAPVLVKDPKNRVVPFPITTGFSEGMDVADYWVQMHGVRKGTVGKVISTQRPGFMTKNLVNTSMNQLISTEDDCGTTKGVNLNPEDRESMDRYLSQDVTLRDGTVLPRNTLVTPEISDRLVASKKKRVNVRSPLKCEHGDGICAKCYGIMSDGRQPEPGTNIGVIAAQAMGEPSTQLALNAFHSGGVATPAEARGAKSTDKFARVEQVLAMPKSLPGSAVLASKTGTVGRVRKDPAGGWEVMLEGTRHFVPSDRDVLGRIRKGVKVRKGTPLSSGPVNPHELLKTTNIDTVRGFLTDELYSLYKDEGPVKRKNFEVVVRAMTNLTKVQDPGEDPNYVRGDVVPATQVAARNRSRKNKKPVLHTPLLKGMADVPRDLFEDWLARLQHTKLKDTLLDAVNQGWKSDIHGAHPIPGVAFGAEFGLPKGKVPPELEHLY